MVDITTLLQVRLLHLHLTNMWDVEFLKVGRALSCALHEPVPNLNESIIIDFFHERRRSTLRQSVYVAVQVIKAGLYMVSDSAADGAASECACSVDGCVWLCDEFGGFAIGCHTTVLSFISRDEHGCVDLRVETGCYITGTFSIKNY